MSDDEKSGMGCFAKGCLTVVVSVIALVALVGGGAYYFVVKWADKLTGDKPAAVRVDDVTETQYQTASARLNKLINAFQRPYETTIEMTGNDLNALVARHPNFAKLKGKIFFTISGGDVAADATIPLDGLDGTLLDRYKSRYFNGRVVAFCEWMNGHLTLKPKLMEANGETVPQSLLDRIDEVELNREIFKNKDAREFMSRVKSIRVVADTLVITTKAGAPPQGEQPADAK